MTARELRKKYLDFFVSRGHELYPSGSLIPYDVTGRLDESLLFNGAGMVQFKPFFRGIAQPPSKRLTNSQKCVRTGDIESVGDLNHLTFFEMMGNFSFGDYFKQDAIAMSWDFLVSQEWLGLDPNRLSFTVFEEDSEAYTLWCEHLLRVGIDPKTRVFRLGEDTNYWPAGAYSHGPPGPCGPNSEMFYWTPSAEPPPSGAYSVSDYLRDESEGKWLEIWNDVFIQFDWHGRLRDPERANEGYEKIGMPPLPFQSVDTGMGLERTTTVLGGYRSVYQTDLFAPILGIIEQVSDGRGKLSGEGVEDTPIDRAVRVIADHARTACFCIADGILPGTAGRGYVLRRLIRRAVLKGQRTLGLEQPFFYKLLDGVSAAMSDYYPELVERRDTIQATLQNEESQFRRTLSAGSANLAERLEILKQGETRVLGGNDAFQLYDTFGFPMEVTKELCEEAGVEVDELGFEAALRAAQERSRSTSSLGNVYGGVALKFSFEKGPIQTEFVGYESAEATAHIVGVLALADQDGYATGECVVALDRTPFYAESGGQVSDSGVIEGNDFRIVVDDVAKQDGVYVHLGKLESAQIHIVGMDVTDASSILNQSLFDREIMARIDLNRRNRIIRNHTATHLLHAALRFVLGTHVTQAGSLVAPDHLRFDFSHSQSMTHDQILEVERLVNTWSLNGITVEVHADVPLEAARGMGAMALFGQKYGEYVRVVKIGDVSIELCGGVHVGQTGEIGLFKIIHESSAAGGVRRVEAITGEAAYQWSVEVNDTLKLVAAKLKAPVAEINQAIDKILDNLREERRKIEKLRTSSVSNESGQEILVGSVHFLARNLDEADAKEAGLVADRLADGHADRVVLVAAHSGGKVTFVCKVGVEAQRSGANAGSLVRVAASVVGGGGGGRPDFATAGGKDVTKIGDALKSAEAMLREQIAAKA